MIDSIRKALEQTRAFSEEDITRLEEAEEALGPITNWSEREYGDAIGSDISNRARVLVAQQAVNMAKGGEVVEVSAGTQVPDKPPYLATDSKGIPIGYDPHDPGQYWVAPSGELWRWDGKRREHPEDRWPYGMPHRVSLVKHISFEGMLIPDEQEKHDANARGDDWFHRGYGCWIGQGGKPYGIVTQDVRDRFIAAQNRAPHAETLVRRQPRVSAA